MLPRRISPFFAFLLLLPKGENRSAFSLVGKKVASPSYGSPPPPPTFFKSFRLSDFFPSPLLPLLFLGGGGREGKKGKHGSLFLLQPLVCCTRKYCVGGCEIVPRARPIIVRNPPLIFLSSNPRHFLVEVCRPHRHVNEDEGGEERGQAAQGEEADEPGFGKKILIGECIFAGKSCLLTCK